MPLEEPALSIHDNNLVSYFVDCEKQEIILHTIFFEQEPNEHTDVIFSGVIAYHFEGGSLGTILFDIYEQEIASIYSTNEDVFIRRRNYGWPVLRYETKESLFAEFQNNGVKGFIVSSSIGLDGFVLAKEMRFVSRTGLPEPVEIGVTEDADEGKGDLS